MRDMLVKGKNNSQYTFLDNNAYVLNINEQTPDININQDILPQRNGRIHQQTVFTTKPITVTGDILVDSEEDYVVVKRKMDAKFLFYKPTEVTIVTYENNPLKYEYEAPGEHSGSKMIYMSKGFIDSLKRNQNYRFDNAVSYKLIISGPSTFVFKRRIGDKLLYSFTYDYTTSGQPFGESSFRNEVTIQVSNNAQNILSYDGSYPLSQYDYPWILTVEVSSFSVGIIRINNEVVWKFIPGEGVNTKVPQSGDVLEISASQTLLKRGSSVYNISPDVESFNPIKIEDGDVWTTSGITGLIKTGPLPVIYL